MSTRHITRAVGLDVGLQAVKFLTGKENLHYGYWKGLEVCAANVGPAQEAYSAKLFKLLPKGKGLRILDIGGGAGETAKKLIAMGHKVDIVVPSAFLAERCRKNTKAKVHESTFEDFTSRVRFDVCLFSESFQYIPMDDSLPKATELLNPGGVIIITDCFRTEAFRKGKLATKVGGGWQYDDFEKAIAKHSLKLTSLEDVTKEVAPSVEVEQAFFNVIGYGIDRGFGEFKAQKPFFAALLNGILSIFLSKNRRKKLGDRLFGQDRNAKNFATLNRYIFATLKPK